MTKPTLADSNDPTGSAPRDAIARGDDDNSLVLVASRLRVDARGGTARTLLEQTFRNPHDAPLEATYALALPADGAVVGFEFAIGDARVVGEVDRREQAEQRYEAAIAQGRSAARLDEARSSVFAQRVGNIPPGETLLARVTVDQPLAWLDEGSWEWRFPTVIAPRYGDGGTITAAPGDAPPPHALALECVVRDALDGLGAPASPSHAIACEAVPGGVRVTLAEPERARHDRDLVVRWRVARPTLGVTLEAGRGDARAAHAAQAHAQLTVVPPDRIDPASDGAIARDLVVLLDTSGSMAGAPLDQARTIVTSLVASLAERDRLELLAFGSVCTRWSAAPTAMTASAQWGAIRWLASLCAGGGTEILDAVREAIRPLRAEAQRQVVLVTDGLTGFEDQLVAHVCERLPRGSRLHTVGVGSAVNRSVTHALARAGRGVEVVVDASESADQATRRLIARTVAPVLVDLEIGGSALLAHVPVQLPDVFAGAPARIALSLAPDGGDLWVRGRTTRGAWEHRVAVPAVEPGQGSAWTATLFAREAVADLEMRRGGGAFAREVDPQIERYGLDYQIATRRTSWVAVGREPAVAPGTPTRTARVGHANPHAMTPGAARRATARTHGVVHWDPVTKTVVHTTAPVRTRRVQVDPSALVPSTRGTIHDLRMGGSAIVQGRARRTALPDGTDGSRARVSPMAQHKRVLKIDGQISVHELAHRMGVTVIEVLGRLRTMRRAAVSRDTALDVDTATQIAAHFHYHVQDVAVRDDAAFAALLPPLDASAEHASPRPPVVAVMGHRAHGKTTLLDAIRGTRVAAREAGGVTQKVAARRVETARGPMVFVDTPGHEAFVGMRARAADVADVVLLVVAADEGVMPVTVESIAHAQRVHAPVVVALTRTDYPDAAPARIAQQLQVHGVVADEYGGSTAVVPVSAASRQGVDALLERLALESEALECFAGTRRPARGVVLDATLDRRRGVVAWVLVQDGTLRTGDAVLAGTSVGRVRAMTSDRGARITEAGPSTPVEVLGLGAVPRAGEGLHVVADLQRAADFAEAQRRRAVEQHGVPCLASLPLPSGSAAAVRVAVLLKADTQSSVEAVEHALAWLATEQGAVVAVYAAVGEITEADVKRAATEGLIVVGFNVRPQGRAAALAETEAVPVRLYDVIYELVDEMKATLVVERSAAPA